MSEEAALGGLPEPGTALELARSADVVEQRCREQEVAPQPWMELRGLTTERRDADGVFEEPARIAVMTIGAGGGESPHQRSELVIGEYRPDDAGQAGVDDLAGDELEEPVELVGITAHHRHEIVRVRIWCAFEGANLELEAPSETLDPTEHPHGVTFREAPVEKLDVVPDACLDATAGVGQLERQVRGAVPRSASLLAGDGEDAVDGPVLGELRDRRHGKRVYD